MTNLTFGAHEIWINSHEIPFATLDVETEVIDVTPIMKVEPDMSWTYVDLRGHFHAFDHEGELPTIKEVVIPHRVALDFDPAEDDEPHSWDEWTETIKKCRICEEVIEPRYVEHTPVWREQAPGRISWKIKCSWPSDVRLPELDTDVSVRIKTGDREWFGVGVVLYRYAAIHELPEVQISGSGKLAYRKTDS